MTKYGKVLLMLSVSDLAVTFIGMHYGFLAEGSGISERIMVQYGVSAFSLWHLSWAVFGVILLESVWRAQPERRPTWRRYYLFVNCAYLIGFFSMIVVQPLYYLLV